jgi:hypothetical protein
MWNLSKRAPYLVCFACTVVLLVQSLDLDNWGVFGPGPGLFPKIVTGFCCIIALLLTVSPPITQTTGPSAGQEEGPLAPPERRTFRIYVLSLILLTVGTAWFGFLLTSVMLALVVTWWGERQSWLKALAFGLACGLAGVIGAGTYMEGGVPTIILDQFIIRLLR